MKSFIIILSSVLVLSLSSSGLNANDDGSEKMAVVSKATENVINACFSFALNGAADMVTTMKKSGVSDKDLEGESTKTSLLKYHDDLLKICMKAVAFKINEAADSMK